ncbi:MAG: HesA/MoeB/ThiF family protein [Myxococcales bacterium]|nr:HesA/MoeB/ThiF family protein [Myxococcales bacterium]
MDERKLRHARQLQMPEIGQEGQERIRASRVLVIGCGGLGAPVVQYLAAAGPGSLTLVDDDIVEVTNLNRQVLHRSADIGRRKVERAQEWVKSLDPSLEVRAIEERLGVENAREIISDHQLVVDCTDGLTTKYLLNDACVLEDRPLVHGAAVGLSGQVLVVRGRNGPCLRCIYPRIPARGEVPSCQEAGVLGSTTGVVGAFMASEALKVLAGVRAAPAKLWSFDLLTPQIRGFSVPKRTDCAACGESPKVDARCREDYEAAASCERPEPRAAGTRT